MLFHYKAIDKEGKTSEGTIESVNADVAINVLQRRGLIVSSIKEDNRSSKIATVIPFLSRVTDREIVILSRQFSTLFESNVSPLRIFRLLGDESENPLLKKALYSIESDLKGGSTIAEALSKHPAIFSSFYVNMIHSGEETGKVKETFLYLADYLDRTHEVVSKVRSALVYPAFVIFVFIAVMVLMFTVVIPKISVILEETGQELPIYTKAILATSHFLVNYGVFILLALLIGIFLLWKYSKTERGKYNFDSFKLGIPYVGDLYSKLYLSRISDNLSTMIESGIPMVKAINVTSNVVGNSVYRTILQESEEKVRGGATLSSSLDGKKEIPSILVQMAKVGEEGGELTSVLKTLSKFYRREVTNAVDAMISIIEPVMIVLLGLGVGVLMASILVPIYNIAAVGF